jgi:hypothetical protein
MAKAGRRFFGSVIGGSLPAALAANWLGLASKIALLEGRHGRALELLERLVAAAGAARLSRAQAIAELNLAQLRIGAAHLEIEQGRKTRVSVLRADRLCRLCGGEDALLMHRQAVVARTGTNQNVEDLKHFLLECPVYDALRAACPAFPPVSSAVLSDPDCVASVFQHVEQSALAKTLYKMKVRRADKLGLTLGI